MFRLIYNNSKIYADKIYTRIYRRIYALSDEQFIKDNIRIGAASYLVATMYSSYEIINKNNGKLTMETLITPQLKGIGCAAIGGVFGMYIVQALGVVFLVTSGAVVISLPIIAVAYACCNITNIIKVLKM